MLALTEDACHAIEGILEQSETATGIRIAPNGDDGSDGSLQLSVAEVPFATDRVIEGEGTALVFVEETASSFLEDKVLDASVTEDREIQFEILAQAA